MLTDTVSFHLQPACKRRYTVDPHLDYKIFVGDRIVSDMAVEQQYVGACSGPEARI